MPPNYDRWGSYPPHRHSRTGHEPFDSSGPSSIPRPSRPLTPQRVRLLPRPGTSPLALLRPLLDIPRAEIESWLADEAPGGDRTYVVLRCSACNCVPLVIGAPPQLGALRPF